MAQYVELHCASAFSFLDGASLPEDLVERAAELGLKAVALADANGVYGAPRFYKAAREAGLKALVGAEVKLDPSPYPLPASRGEGEQPRLTLLVGSRAGYKNLCRLLTAGALGRKKGEARVTLEQVAARADGLVCLTGGDEGPVSAAWSRGPEECRAALSRLMELFPGRLYVELQRHRLREQERRNLDLLELAGRLGLPVVATNGVRYARSADKELYDVLTCLRLKTTLDEAGSRLAANRERHLKSAAEMSGLFADLPEALANSVELASRLDFTLADLGYRLPDYPLPPGETPSAYLRKVTWEGAAGRIRPLTEAHRRQLAHELGVIEKLDLAGYFLIVRDIAEFCRKEKILAQGRGSAANSVVCYALGITAVDPVKMDLLFERFLSEERGEWPDIDLDLPSGDRRERVIQHVYRKYGERGAAMTANVITYRPKLAAREVAKVLGYSPEQTDRLSRKLGSLAWEELRAAPEALPAEFAAAGLDPAEPRVKKLMRLWLRIQNLPRHLGQHSGGMVISGGPLDELVPLEPASMPGRVVVQWDKDDCEDLRIIKVDLLGLGMLEVLEEAVPLVEAREGVRLDLAHLPPDDPRVYDMLNKADTVGVFQVESRAQMASLPRNAPRTFYDLVIQVAIIRPGPIVGGMIRPFFDRRQGKAEIGYPHPCLEPILKRTLGVPVFQEQVLKMAMAAAGFSGGEAEELRRAMGFKRSLERMESLERRLREGMRRRGIVGETQERIVRMITAFAQYGFPESHAASFALIAYASAYLKAHHPVSFYVALLNAWPMGFYHPATIVKDAQRRGVPVLPIDVRRSGWNCRWEGVRSQLSQLSPRGAVRLGLKFVKGLAEAGGRRVESEAVRAPFESPAELARRCGLRPDELDRLAFAGALSGFGLTRRAALWQAAATSRPVGPLFEAAAEASSPLPEMSPAEETLADYHSAELTTGPHPMAHLRPRLWEAGAVPAAELWSLPDGSTVRTAGSVIVRQRPETAKGFVFLTIEDETGMAQAIVSPALFKASRAEIVGSAALMVEGALQKEDGALSVKARRVWRLDAPADLPARDFR